MSVLAAPLFLDADCPAAHAAQPREAVKHTIPLQFKITAAPRVRRVFAKGRVCSRVALYGSGTLPGAQRLMIALKTVLNCRYFGGFSRNGVWEAILMFDKNRCERPYEEEIERCIEYFYKEGSVGIDVLDSRVSKPVLAFLHRLSKMATTFGVFPSHLIERVRQYQEECSRTDTNDLVLELTGVRFNAQNMIDLYHSLQHARGEVTRLREQMRSYSINPDVQHGSLASGSYGDNRG